MTAGELRKKLEMFEDDMIVRLCGENDYSFFKLVGVNINSIIGSNPFISISINASPLINNNGFVERIAEVVDDDSKEE